MAFISPKSENVMNKLFASAIGGLLAMTLGCEGGAVAQGDALGSSITVALNFTQRADATTPAGERAFFACPLPTRLTIGACRPLQP